MPAEPLGVTGFDVGVVVTGTDISKSSNILSKASGGSSPVSTLYVPKLHVAKGLPFGIDVAAFIASVPTTNVNLMGAELRYALMDGGVALPAVAIRGSVSRLSGVEQLSFDTRGWIPSPKALPCLLLYAGLAGCANSNATLAAWVV
jgi:hypothetical protein